MCDDKNSDDCQAEYNNALNNDTLDYFYRRCAREKPLITRCKLCCNADAAGNYTFSALKDCFRWRKWWILWSNLHFNKMRLWNESMLNYECNSADIRMIRNNLLTILAFLYLFSYFLMLICIIPQHNQNWTKIRLTSVEHYYVLSNKKTLSEKKIGQIKTKLVGRIGLDLF